MATTLQYEPSLEPAVRRRRRAARGVALAVVGMLLVAVGIGLGRASVTAPDHASDPGAAAEPTSNGADGPEPTRAAAVRMAVDYVLALGHRASVTDWDYRVGVVRRFSVPERVDDLVAQVDVDIAPSTPGELSAAAAAPVTASAWRLVPVGYRVDQLSADTAKISIWSVQVVAGVGAVQVPAMSIWATISVPVHWTVDGWKVDIEACATELGPTPGAPPSPQSSDLDVIAADQTFEVLPR